MIQAYRQRAMREGIVYKQISFDFPIEDDDQIVKAYEQAITPRTRLIHVTHMINWVGQTMPVAKIADMAHARGIEVVADGAHSFGLMDFKVTDLHCDYFGTSLHKFLSAPIGTGMMWVRQDKIEKLWPLTCNSTPHSADIRKFETLGTRSFPLEQGIGEAINFHQGIGAKRKEERIRYLKDYWASRVQQTKKVKLHTSLNAEVLLRRSAASASIARPPTWKTPSSISTRSTPSTSCGNIAQFCQRHTPRLTPQPISWRSVRAIQRPRRLKTNDPLSTRESSSSRP